MLLRLVTTGVVALYIILTLINFYYKNGFFEKFVSQSDDAQGVCTVIGLILASVWLGFLVMDMRYNCCKSGLSTYAAIFSLYFIVLGIAMLVDHKLDDSSKKYSSQGILNLLLGFMLLVYAALLPSLTVKKAVKVIDY